MPKPLLSSDFLCLISKKHLYNHNIIHLEEQASFKFSKSDGINQITSTSNLTPVIFTFVRIFLKVWKSRFFQFLQTWDASIQILLILRMVLLSLVITDPVSHPSVHNQRALLLTSTGLL